jgi:hypothetical protein
MTSTHIVYLQHADTAPDSELRTLANVYKFVRDCQRNKEAATSPVGRPDDAKGSKHDSRQQQYTG